MGLWLVCSAAGEVAGAVDSAARRGAAQGGPGWRGVFPGGAGRSAGGGQRAAGRLRAARGRGGGKARGRRGAAARCCAPLSRDARPARPSRP